MWIAKFVKVCRTSEKKLLHSFCHIDNSLEDVG